jgi:hypothetical protein
MHQLKGLLEKEGGVVHGSYSADRASTANNGVASTVPGEVGYPDLIIRAWRLFRSQP